MRAPGRKRAKARSTSRGRPVRDPALWLLIGASAVAAILYLDRLHLPALAVVILAATALERHRQVKRATPLTLAATPKAWWEMVQTTVGAPAVALALALIGAAWLVFADADFGLNDTKRPAALPGAVAVARAVLPSVPVHEYVAGHRFTVDGARFRVTSNSTAPWARAIRSSAVARGDRWIAVAVDTTNLGRRRFDPNDLDYRLHDRSGGVYRPVIHGGTGPASMSSPGLLGPGLTAESRLSFRVPKRARGLMLVFEPTIGGPDQVHVAIPAGT